MMAPIPSRTVGSASRAVGALSASQGTAKASNHASPPSMNVPVRAATIAPVLRPPAESANHSHAHTSDEQQAEPDDQDHSAGPEQRFLRRRDVVLRIERKHHG